MLSRSVTFEVKLLRRSVLLRLPTFGMILVKILRTRRPRIPRRIIFLIWLTRRFLSGCGAILFRRDSRRGRGVRRSIFRGKLPIH